MAELRTAPQWTIGIPSRRFLAWCLAVAVALFLTWATVQLGPFFTAALVGAVVIVLAIVRFPWIGIVLLMASVPAQEFGALQAGGQSLTLTRAMFPLAVVGYFIALVIHREPIRGTRILIPYAALVGVIVASLVWSSSISATGAEIGRWIIAFVSFVVAVQFLATASQRRILIVVGVMALAGIFEATFGVTQSILALGPESFRVGTEGSRAFGTFGQPNSYAGYLEMVLFPVGWLGVYLVTQIPDRLRRYRLARLEGMEASRNERVNLAALVLIALLFASAAAIIAGGIVASYSRGAWLGVAAGGGTTVLLYHRRLRRALVFLVPLALLLLAGGTSGLLPASVAERIGSGIDDIRPFDASSVTITDDNFAAAERMAHWQAGWGMFRDNVATGVGAGNFNERYPDYFVREEFQFTRGHAHNFYIHLLAELGIPGLAAYLVLAGSIASLAVLILLRAPSGFERMLALGAFGTIVSVGVHNVFENLHVLNLSIQLGVIWALVIAAHRRWRRVAEPPVMEQRR